MTNNLIIITCHCNDSNKLNVLNENIDLLKSNGFNILLISHISIPFNIQQKVEYYIFDKSNPIIYPPVRTFRFWNTRAHPTDKTKIIKLRSNHPDYGWTVFNQFIKSSNFALDLNYSYYSFINYDISLTDQIIKTLKKPTSNFIVSKVVDSNSETRWPSLVFNIIKKNNLIKLINKMSFNDYIKKEDNGKGIFHSAEDYWRVIISPFNYELFNDTIEDKIDFGTPFIFNQNIHNDLFRIFFEKSDNPKCLPRLFKQKKYIKLKVNKQIIKLEPIEQIVNLPKNIKNIGFYDYKNNYFDLTDEYNKSDNQYIDILDA